MSNVQITFIFLIIFLIWIIRFYYKLYDKTLNRFVMSIGGLLILWMQIRIFKNYVPDSLEIIFWYLFYIPMIIIPALYYLCSEYLLKRISKIKIMIVSSIASLLLLLVLTNNFHSFVFKLADNFTKTGNYTHRPGYYIIAGWIIFLFIKTLISLTKRKIKLSGIDIKIVIPISLILIGIIYTVFYVSGIGIASKLNMSVVLGTLMCLGIESLLYLDLIPNNQKYQKLYNQSKLEMAIIDKNDKKVLQTSKKIEIPNIVINDINQNLKDNYLINNIIYEINALKDIVVVMKKDLSEVIKLENEIKEKNEELIIQHNALKKEEQIKKEIYKLELQKEVLLKLEQTIVDKKKEIKKIISKKNISNNDLNKIKLLISYCKRKCSLIISDLNNDNYQKDMIEIMFEELIVDSKKEINGSFKVDNVVLSSSEMSEIYEILFNVILNIEDTDLLAVLKKNDNQLELRILINRGISIIKKLKLSKEIKVKESVYEDSTNIIFILSEVIL